VLTSIGGLGDALHGGAHTSFSHNDCGNGSEKVGQEQAVDDFIHEMLENGNIELAPQDSKLCFALLVVDKRDDLGQVTGSCVCVDLKALNKVMLPDLYPLPSLSEVLAKAVRKRGPDSYRFKIDGTQSYHMFAMK
jgi:hypothetical protein